MQLQATSATWPASPKKAIFSPAPETLKLWTYAVITQISTYSVRAETQRKRKSTDVGQNDSNNRKCGIIWELFKLKCIRSNFKFFVPKKFGMFFINLNLADNF